MEKNIYEWLMMQLCHDVANVAQKMISVSYEYESQGIKIGKIDGEIKRLSELLAIYKNILSADDQDFDELIDSMHILYGNIIEVDGKISSIQVLRMTLVYALWLAKNHDIRIELKDEAASVSIIDKNEEKIHYYAPDKTKDSPFMNIIYSMIEDYKLNISLVGKSILIKKHF